MIFGSKAPIVTIPPPDGDKTVAAPARDREISHRVDVLDDEMRFLKERFTALQARLLAQIRELRRAVEDFEPEAEDEYDNEER